MSIPYGDLTIHGRNGKLVPVTDCKLEPLNLLIPGGAPILVPKNRAWRPPPPPPLRNDGDPANQSNVSNVAAPSVAAAADYDAEAEDDTDDDESQPLITKSQSRSKNTQRHCRKSSYVKDKAREAKHRRKAQQHLKKAEKEREEADGERERLAKRVKRQEAYIAKLKTKYAAEVAEETKRASSTSKAMKKKKKNKNKKAQVGDESEASAASADEGGATTTDDSVAVREMLKNIKIRAGGREYVNPNDKPWSVSEDSQLLVRQAEGETYADIGKAMGRRKGEVSRRYKFLKKNGAKVPGGDETVGGDGGADNSSKDGVSSSDAAVVGDSGAETTDDADKTGDDTTDAEKTGEETTDAEKTGEETTDAEKTGEETTDAEKTGEETTDAEKTGEETTDAEKTDDETKDSVATDAFASNLLSALEALVEEKATEQAGESPPKSDKSNDKSQTKQAQQQQQKKKKKKQKCSPKVPAENSAAGESGYDASASEAIEEAGTKAYIGQYAKRILADANAGRTKIPEACDRFDEDDCILLALADGYRRSNRWLEIQADFANITGRMVPVEVLKWKFGEGEKPEDHWVGL